MVEQLQNLYLKNDKNCGATEHYLMHKLTYDGPNPTQTEVLNQDELSANNWYLLLIFLLELFKATNITQADASRAECYNYD